VSGAASSPRCESKAQAARSSRSRAIRVDDRILRALFRVEDCVKRNNRCIANSWLLLDADIALSRARFTEFDPAGVYIPGSIDKVASLGVAVVDHGPWFGHDSVRSRSTTLAYVRVGYRITPRLRAALDVFNLFNREASDTDYYYASRLKGEPAEGVADIHFHPVEPRRFRVKLTAIF
jgi:hypothetical protein